MFDLIKKIRFKRDKNAFQAQMNRDRMTIGHSSNVMVWPIKLQICTASLPILTRTCLRTTSRQLTKKTKDDSVNRQAKAMAKPLKIEDQLKQYSNNEAFITLKDHKDDL